MKRNQRRSFLMHHLNSGYSYDIVLEERIGDSEVIQTFLVTRYRINAI